MAQVNLSMKQKQNAGHGEQTVVAKGEGGDGLGVGISGCILLYTEWINNKVLLNSTGNYNIL